MNITEEQLKKIFELASMEKRFSENKVTESDITEALIEIERKLHSFSSGIKIEAVENKKVLIADDLELSIYQLTTVLKRIGITPTVARHKEEALSELQKVNFDCVVFDLFIPDSSDGLDLIKAAVEKRKNSNKYYKIIAISSTDNKSLVDLCYESGADFYIQKDKDWHSKLLKYISSSFKTDTNISFNRYIINNNIVTYIVKRFNDTKIFNTIIKNVNSSIYTGLKNILFDMKEITTFDNENAYIFADIYKLCAENGGKFILINPSLSVKEALSMAFLEDVIPYAASVEEAVSLISENDNTTNPQ